MNQNKEVGTKEENLLRLFQKMIGSEKEGGLTLHETLKNNIVALRRIGLPDEEKLEIINRILALMGSDRICLNFLTIIFKNTDFLNSEAVEKCVDKFRFLCLLEYADFKEGFEIFRKDGNKLESAWKRYFSRKIKEKGKKLVLPLLEIPIGQRYQLGYLAYTQHTDVRKARERLLEILEEAQAKGLYSLEEIEELTEKGEDIYTLWANAGISEVDNLILSEEAPSPISFNGLTKSVQYYCAERGVNEIEEAQRSGKQNTIQYLSTRDIDVYVATSMRNVLDFSMNAFFVKNLSEHEEISTLDLTFFDPTQAYLPDRIQKGLLENIMIERALVTIYNAQESDTFGKDAEAGITHAFGKPVIVYVPRLFGEDLSKKLKEKIDKMGIYFKLQEIYSVLDYSVVEEQEEFLKTLKYKEYLTGSEVEDLSKPDKDKRDAINAIIDKKIQPLLDQLEAQDLQRELIQRGYKPLFSKKEGANCVERIKKLESRALLFLELHPLTFQISPLDGIARGVFVTRSVNKTAKLLRALLMGKLEYEIKTIKNNMVLCDKITHSPIRAYPKAETGEDKIVSDSIKRAISDIRSRLMPK